MSPHDRPKITGMVISDYLARAISWSIPALLLLPLYLGLIAISVLAGEGALLEIATKARGGVTAALGLLLNLSALVLLVLVVMASPDAEGWTYGGFAVLLTGGFGVYFTRRELRRIADERAAKKARGEP